MRVVEITHDVKLNRNFGKLETGQKVWGGEFVSVRKRGLLVGCEFLIVIHAPADSNFFFTGKAVVIEIRHLSSKPERYRYTFRGQSPLLMNWDKVVAEKMGLEFEGMETGGEEGGAQAE